MTRIAIVAALLLSGCYSFSTLGRARVVEPGRVEVYGAPEALIVATSTGAAIRPVGELGMRVGVTRELDLGARITTFGLTATARVQLLRSADPTRDLDLLLAPGLAYTAQDRLAIELPLVFGVNLGEHQLVLAPRFVWQMRLAPIAGPAAVSFLYLGASVGIVIRLDDHVALMPEVATLGQIYADPGYASNLAEALGLEASLGLIVDP